MTGAHNKGNITMKSTDVMPADAPLTGGRAARRRSDNAEISVVVPTLNEAANLPHVLTRIPACVDEVVLVDGRSTDDTVAVARIAPSRHPNRRTERSG